MQWWCWAAAAGCGGEEGENGVEAERTGLPPIFWTPVFLPRQIFATWRESKVWPQHTKLFIFTMASSQTASSSGGGSSNSVTDVLDRVIGLSKDNKNNINNKGDDHDAFIASDKWRGVKNGYVFRTSPEFGTGYHRDDNNQYHQQHQTTNINGDASSSLSLVAASTAESTTGREKKRARFDTSRDITHAIPARSSSKQHHHDPEGGGRITTTTTTTGEELLAQAEASLSSQQSHSSTKLLELTRRGIQSASSSLEKTKQRNSLLRAQYENDPEKYMLEELALHDEIMNFSSAAVNLSLYEPMVQCGVITNSFLELMNHDNVDVALCVVSVMMELLDPALLLLNEENDAGNMAAEIDNTPKEKARYMAQLANSFIDGGGMELLSSNLGRLDESVEEEAKGVEDILTLVESLLDLDRMGVLLTNNEKDNNDDDDEDDDVSRSSSIVMCICQQTTFLSWLFQRIEKSDSSNKEEDSALTTAAAPVSPAVLKLHASEVLSAILQHEDYSMHRCGGKISTLPNYTSSFHDNTSEEKIVGMKERDKNNSTIDGVEILLMAIATYRKSDPQIEVECEFLENVFDALAASLLREDNVADFVEAEGIELMLRCLRQNVHAGGGALKVLNFALSASATASATANNLGEYNAYRKACETFIQAGGLKIIFPLYMGRKSAIPCPASCSDGGSNLAKRVNKNGVGGVDSAVVVSKRAKRAAQARKQWLVEVEQNTIHIIYALTRHIAKDSQHDAHARLLVKFLEEECVGSSRVFACTYVYNHWLLSEKLLLSCLVDIRLFCRKNVTERLSCA
jgi:beta-catenin-like protein 1